MLALTDLNFGAQTLTTPHRRTAGALAAAGIVGLGLARPPVAQALVKGNAPPPDMRKAKMGEKPKAANMEDARALGRQKVRAGVRALGGGFDGWWMVVMRAMYVCRRLSGRGLLRLHYPVPAPRVCVYNRRRSSSTRATRAAATRRPRTVRHGALGVLSGARGSFLSTPCQRLLPHHTLHQRNPQNTCHTHPNPGDRYRDIVVGSGGKALADGDTCAIRYRALRLGKRSRDGLSGEASTVFSFGYGEDDDKCVRACVCVWVCARVVGFSTGPTAPPIPQLL